MKCIGDVTDEIMTPLKAQVVPRLKRSDYIF